MEKETSLSDKIGHCKWWPNCNKVCETIEVEDVREAVLRLKKRFKYHSNRTTIIWIIDEIFGEKLMESEGREP